MYMKSKKAKLKEARRRMAVVRDSRRKEVDLVKEYKVSIMQKINKFWISNIHQKYN